MTNEQSMTLHEEAFMVTLIEYIVSYVPTLAVMYSP